MEIAMNMVQTTGPEASAVAAGGPVNATAPSPDGAFALFFQQVLSELSAVVPESTLTAMPEDSAETAKGEMTPEEGEVTEKKAATEITLPVELQAALGMQMMVPQQPAVPVKEQPEGETPLAAGPGSVEAVASAQVPQDMPASEPAPRSVAALSGEAKGRPAELTVGAASVNAPQPESEKPVVTGPVFTVPVRGEMKIVREQQPVTPHAASPVLEQNAQIPGQAVQQEVTEAVDQPAAKVASDESAVAVHGQPTPKAMEVHKGLDVQKEATVKETADAAGEGSPVVKVAVKEAAPRQSGHGEQQEQQEKPQAAKVKEPVAPTLMQTAETPRVEEPTKAAQATNATETTSVLDHDHIMVQVKEKLSAHPVRSGDGEISLRLHPEELGELKIVLKMNDQRLKVDIIAQNQGVRDVLMQNLDGLRETLSRQNITVDRFDVTTGGGSQQEFQEGRQAARERNFHQYPSAKLSLPEQEQRVVATAWKPRENSLVDVRF